MNEDFDLFGENNAFWTDEFDKSWDPSKFKKRNKNDEKAIAYYGKNPAPNYSDFGVAEFIDSQGREYKRASPKFLETYIEKGIVKEPIPNKLSQFEGKDWGTQVLWIRIPIRQRGSVHFPSPYEEKINLMEISSQVALNGVSREVWHMGNKKTGFIVLDKMRSEGMSLNPSLFLDLLRIKKKKTLFG